ncbi:acyl-CoA thioesterase [Ahrensia kielensis]|uniref:acyl-CoA thioesterase n=1 Tax=Ahrensia kielensis TaxID=76980 RepID=UPI000365B13B|nr:thioesterase family protein [Ahrensia kielensis]
MMVFNFPQKVLFKHCDPAGIVFYPRYFEMINDVIEAFFADVVKAPFEEMHQHAAVPTAEIQCKFLKPSRHGDQLNLQLAAIRVGRSSFELTVDAYCGDEHRFSARATIVYVNENGRPTSWPDAMRIVLEKNIKGDGA